MIQQTTKKMISWSRRKLFIWLLICIILGIVIGGVTVGGSLFWHFGKRAIAGGFSPSSAMLHHHFERLDGHPEDGYLSLDEWKLFANQLIERFDDNEDNIISLDEVPRFARGWQHELMDQLSLDKQLTKQQILDFFIQEHQASDQNHDGLVTLDEFNLAHSKELFKRIDLDNDSVISFKEFLQSQTRHKRRKNREDRKKWSHSYD